MTVTFHRIKCAHCHGYHGTSRDVWFCAQSRAAMVPPHAASVSSMAEGFKPDYDPWSQFKTPRAMIEQINNGRYAVRADSNEPYMFFRVTRPVHGKKKGAFVIQTQHSDMFRDRLVVYPTGRLFVYKPYEFDHRLLLVSVDPITATRNYARELNVCGSCGKKLTDERSRYYGIGPECEKKGNGIKVVRAVDEEKGPYRPGMD